MIDSMDFVALRDAEQAEIVGGELFPWGTLAWWIVNNAGAIVDGFKDGYADARAT